MFGTESDSRGLVVKLGMYTVNKGCRVTGDSGSTTTTTETAEPVSIYFEPEKLEAFS